MTAPFAVVLSCEHASNAVPARLRYMFAGERTVLATHRGYDIGAAAVARTLAKLLGAPLVCGDVTRLVIDLNRSIGNPGLFSEFSRGLTLPERAAVVAQFHAPFRAAVRALLDAALKRPLPVVHLSVHSFTPTLHGVVRNNDIGLLYDPRRASELQWARALRAQLNAVRGDWRVRMNYPYRGAGDGHTSLLRRVLASARYVGVEIEINQALLANDANVKAVAASLATAVQRMGR